MSIPTSSFNQITPTSRSGRGLAGAFFHATHSRTAPPPQKLSQRIQMLFSSALIALVGAAKGGRVACKLRLWNTHRDGGRAGALLPDGGIECSAQPQRLAAQLESALHIFDLMSMQHLHTLPTSPNPLGLAALSPDPTRATAPRSPPTARRPSRDV